MFRFFMQHLSFTAPLRAQARTGGVRVGTSSTPDASAVLDVSSTSEDLLTPRMDSAARMSIATPATGLLVCQTGPRQGY